MHPLHKEVLIILNAHADPKRSTKLPEGYMGNDHPWLGIPVPLARKLAKQWAKAHLPLPQKDYEGLLVSLAKGKTQDEKYFVGRLLEYMPMQRKKIRLDIVDELLNHMEGWCEVDTMCQTPFTAAEVLANWDEWEKFLVKLSKDENPNKRRASLVLLTHPTGYSSDPKLSDLAFTIIDRLKVEKSILITKAISWLLRTLVQFHPVEVRKYIDANRDSLPKIAIRETTRKLETGKK